MPALPKEEERRRLELYQKGLTDQQIADALGLRWERISQWRRNKGLTLNNPSGGTGHRDYHYEPPVRMSQALTPEQCVKMRDFLGLLLELAGEVRGMKPNVGRFLEEYRKLTFGSAWGRCNNLEKGGLGLLLSFLAGEG